MAGWLSEWLAGCLMESLMKELLFFFVTVVKEVSIVVGILAVVVFFYSKHMNNSVTLIWNI